MTALAATWGLIICPQELFENFLALSQASCQQ
jgi:hypothetical protein